MTSASIIPIRSHDRDLAKEAREAARITLGIRNGDAAAETAMVERYSRGLGILLARRTGDDERARDLLQETFCIAIEKLRKIQLDNPERLAGYLRGIAVRVALNAGRRRRREPLGIEPDAVAAVPDHAPGQIRQIASEQARSAVHELLEEMRVQRDRDLLIRFYVHDQDKDEICRALDLNSVHFNRVLFRAKARLRKIVEESGAAADLLPTTKE